MEDRDMTFLRHWLALCHTPGLGPQTLAQLLVHCPDAQQILQAGRNQWLAWGLSPALAQALAEPAWATVDQDLAWAEHPTNHILTWQCADYPALLREIAGAPPVLYVRGTPQCLGDLQLAMVGSRNPSAAGRQTAHDFAGHLAQAGLIITSGLALGIDAASHAGALAAGGRTVAVMGTGLDRVYPAQHRELAHQIAERGALVSEFAIGSPPRAEHFPRRNRIISGLSLGVLVVEAAQRSGSLISARLAADQGREVFAIPGSIHNPLARGCHLLLRQGAKLVETAADILTELGPLAHYQAAAGPLTAAGDPPECAEELTADQQNLLESMGYDPVAVDTLAARSRLTAREVSSMLLILELRGYIESGPGGWYCRLK